MFLRTMFLAILTLWLAPGLCLAQSLTGNGTILGVVKDVTGAAVPGAKVTVTHAATGATTPTQTNGEGYFSTPPLQIGVYRIRVEVTGMKAWESELTLETGRTVEVSPVVAPGQVSETVTVTGVIPLVTTADPAEATTLDSQRIQELPINGRDLNTLVINVTPGVEQIDGDPQQIRSGGLMWYSTNFVQDGALSNEREQGGASNIQGLESIAEVRVETSSGSARYNSPTSVIVSTRGGANRLRFTAYETVRNNAFGVARARQDVNLSGAPFKAPKLVRNEFGGSVSGPVFLPTFGLNGKKYYNGRNRTFFFFSREGLELRQGFTRDFSVPTMPMRSGDFSGLIDSQGRAITVYDPLTTSTQTVNGRPVAVRLPFNNNQIPIQRQSPVAKYVWGVTPVPSDITNPLVTTNLRVAVPTSSIPNFSDNPTTARIDHRVGSGDSFFFKVNRSTRPMSFIGSNATSGPPTANKEANMSYFTLQGKAASANWTHLFTPGFFVESAANRTWQQTTTRTGPTDRDWSTELGLPNPLGELGWPNQTGLDFANYIQGDNRRWVKSINTNASQNYSWIKGTHNVGFGWNLFTERHLFLPDQGAVAGAATYGSLATSLMSSTLGSTTSPQAVPQTGSNAANFFLGYAATYTVNLQRTPIHVGQNTYGFYVQDNYKVTSRLTVMPGFRWDINPAFVDRDRLINAFDVPSHSILLPESLDYYYKLGVTSPAVVNIYKAVDVQFKSAAELNRSPDIFRDNYFDFGPRAGFAYRLGDGAKQWVVRGGYGIYISPIPMRTLLSQFSSMAPFRASFSYNPNSAAQSPDGIANYLLRSVPTVVAGVNSANVVSLANPVAVGRGLGVVAMGDLPSMKIHEWNLAVEKQVGAASVLRLAYTGKHGIKADQLNELNPTQTDYVWYATTGLQLPTGAFANVARRPYDQTAYTSVRVLEKTGFINTSTFAVEFQRRFSKGLGFQVFHNMTNAFRAAGNSFRDGGGNTKDAFLPGTVPTDRDELNRFLNYRRDPGVPKHRTRWNWNYDLPFGKGRPLAGSVSRALDTLIGGWKLSGSGTLVSTYYALPANNWGEIGKFESYGTKYPILDCRSTPANATNPKDERCISGYLWFNGYISERNIESRNAAGLRNGVFGLPAGYQPAMKPVTPWPKGGLPNAPGSTDWDTNFVYVRLKDGSQQRVSADTGLHPWRNQYRTGPFNWTTDASLMKFFSITERLRLRLNVDVFNVFNLQGLNVPNAEGIVSLANSYSGIGIRPRQVQLTARLEW